MGNEAVWLARDRRGSMVEVARTVWAQIWRQENIRRKIRCEDEEKESDLTSHVSQDCHTQAQFQKETFLSAVDLLPRSQQEVRQTEAALFYTFR